MLSDFERQQLTNQAECFIHTHPREVLNQTSHLQLENAARVKEITSATYALTLSDEQIAVSVDCAITLPAAANGKEYHITLTASGITLTITPDGTDTIAGESSAILNVQWTSIHLKADTGGNWIIL